MTVNNVTAIARNPKTFCLGFWHELLTDEAPPVARGMAPVGRGGVGRTSCRLAGVPVGVTCSDGGMRGRLVEVPEIEWIERCVHLISIAPNNKFCLCLF